MAVRGLCFPVHVECAYFSVFGPPPEHRRGTDIAHAFDTVPVSGSVLMQGMALTIMKRKKLDDCGELRPGKLLVVIFGCSLGP